MIVSSKRRCTFLPPGDVLPGVHSVTFLSALMTRMLLPSDVTAPPYLQQGAR